MRKYYLQFGGGSKEISASSRWILKYSTTKTSLVTCNTKTTAIAEYANERIYPNIFSRRARPWILKNYILWQLKLVYLGLVFWVRQFFSLFPNITITEERLEVNMQIRDQLVTSLSALPFPILVCANYARCAASRIYLPFGRCWSWFRWPGTGSAAASGSLAFTILRGSPLAIRRGTQCAVVWHDQQD